VLALGVFHYTDYFELSSQFEWVASPVVMGVLGVIALAEVLADAHPDIAEFSDMATMLPKLVAGFIAFAAATGSVDASLLELGASGLMGAATAGGAQLVRSKIKEPIADLDIAEVGIVHSAGETAGTVLLTWVAVSSPWLVPLVLILGIAVGFGIGRWAKGRTQICIHCEADIPWKAPRCVNCGCEQVEGAAGAGPPGSGSDGAEAGG
jgi:hypothetical protein